jgi:hypothetical protein
MAGTPGPGTTVFTGTGAYDPVKLVVGPGKMYFNVPIPADGASLSTILTGGIPTGTGFLAGYTKSGTTYHSAMTLTGYEVDEVRSPIFFNPTQETVSIQGTLVQVAEKEALLAMLPNYNFKTPDSYHVGGLTSWPATAYPSVLVVGQNRATPGKIVAVMIYKALNTQEFIMAITRQNPSETAFTFSANAIGTREAGDQLGQVWLEP